MLMKINDRIYGTVEINSPSIIRLINSKPLQRLKGIAQFGVPDIFYHIKGYSRFEHSVGVMILLKKLGASEEEQIAGLLHDISHTAFSHMIDWVLGDGSTENFQDNQHEKFLHTSRVQKILEQYKYSSERIANHNNFKLLERAIPNLCADRIDYSIREFPENVVKRCINGLTVKNERIVFSDKDSALLFARNFLARQKVHWGWFEAVSRYKIFATLLRKALNKRIIKLDDFWKDDRYIIEKLNKTKNKGIQKLLSMLRKKSLSDLPKSDEIAKKKFRYVDPEFIFNGKLIRLTKADKNFKDEIALAREENSKGIIIPLV